MPQPTTRRSRSGRARQLRRNAHTAACVGRQRPSGVPPVRPVVGPEAVAARIELGSPVHAMTAGSPRVEQGQVLWTALTLRTSLMSRDRRRCGQGTVSRPPAGRGPTASITTIRSLTGRPLAQGRPLGVARQCAPAAGMGRGTTSAEAEVIWGSAPRRAIVGSRPACDTRIRRDVWPFCSPLPPGWPPGKRKKRR
jgi:hypothetical protein